MQNHSLIYTFLDGKNNYLVHFIDGHQLISELRPLHQLSSGTFDRFSKVILSVELLVSFLKKGEGLGLYLESTSPAYRLNIETSANGEMRTLILPEDLDEFPENFTGNCRLVKFMQNKNPYSSILQLENKSFSQIINQILNDSYQIQSEVVISNHGPQGIMAMKLPAFNINNQGVPVFPSLERYWDTMKNPFQHIFDQSPKDEGLIKKSFESLSMEFLSHKPVFFHCPCSKERFIQVLSSMQAKGETLFDKDKQSLETKCDYCKKIYEIEKDDLKPTVQ